MFSKAVVGKIMGIRTAYSEDSQSIQRMMITLIIVFDGLAKLLEENLLSRNEEPEVLVATNINPKLVGRRLFLNKTSTTNFLIDNECVAGASYLQSKEGSTSNPKKYVLSRKLNH
ncbi:hypothetical protein HID58_013036 [Brassica napus]|uniref:Uncharacterized protein n=1 Tax=Brassica napus TaxID=3708 RepID=A0ABQ8E2S5_BRANA|nr:hypothetical protein HID58_013036 [Brassica napus]